MESTPSTQPGGKTEVQKETHRENQRRYLRKVAADPIRNARRQQGIKRHRQRRQEILNQIKSAPCQDCQNTFPPRAMDFHHRNPDTKVAMVSANLMGVHIVRELAKCDLLCACCHRLRHA